MFSKLFIILSLIIFLISTGVVVILYFLRSRNIIKYNKLGLKYQNWEMWNDSVRYFQMALELDANHALSHYNLGFVLYFGKKQVDAAISEFKLAIVKDTKMAPAYYALGHAQFHGKRDLDEAWNNLETAVELDPSLAQASNTMGLIEIKREEWKKAIECFRKAISINERFDSAYCNLSIALSYQGRNSEALDNAQKYAELNPHSALAHNNLGNIYGAAGKRIEAIKALLTSLKINPDDWNVHFWLGCLRLQMSELKKAVVSLHEALKLHGEFALAHYNLALCYEQDNNRALAKKHIEKAIELNPALGENMI